MPTTVKTQHHNGKGQQVLHGIVDDRAVALAHSSHHVKQIIEFKKGHNMPTCLCVSAAEKRDQTLEPSEDQLHLSRFLS